MSLFGAEIVKIERPGSGDVLRGVGPFIEHNGQRRSGGEMRVMGNKKSVALDITSIAGREIFFKLVESSDVVWTNQKPSTLSRLDITFDSLKLRKPDIVYATLSGFGHGDLASSGPLSEARAFDLIAQGLAGLQFRAGSEDGGPGYNGLALGDEVTSTLTVLGVVMALYRRKCEGGAQRVDVAMHDAMVFVNELALGSLSVLGRVPPRGRSGTSAPYGSFVSNNGWVNIAIGGDPLWRRFCEAIERFDLIDDERYISSFGRVTHVESLERIVGDWTSSRSTEEIVEALQRFGVPCAPVLDIPEVLVSEQVSARKMLIEIDDPIAGQTKVVGNPVKMNELDNAFADPPPLVGQDTMDVLTAYAGLTSEEVMLLAGQGVVSVST